MTSSNIVIQALRWEY